MDPSHDVTRTNRPFGDPAFASLTTKRMVFTPTTMFVLVSVRLTDAVKPVIEMPCDTPLTSTSVTALSAATVKSISKLLTAAWSGRKIVVS